MPALVDLGLIIIPHPLADLLPDEVTARAEEIFPEIERLLNLKADAIA